MWYNLYSGWCAVINPPYWPLAVTSFSTALRTLEGKQSLKMCHSRELHCCEMQMNRRADDWNQRKLGGNNLCAAFEVQSTSLHGVDMAHTGCDLIPWCITFMTYVYFVGRHGLAPNWTENETHMALYSLHTLDLSPMGPPRGPGQK